MPKRKCTEINSLIGGRLKFYRLQSGLTQQQVADSLKIDRSTYTKYENGTSAPSNEVMVRIVKLFDVDYNSLLGPYGFAEKTDFDELKASDSFDSKFVGIAGLKSDEKSIVACYRVMTEKNREKLIKIMQEMLDEQLTSDYNFSED